MGKLTVVIGGLKIVNAIDPSGYDPLWVSAKGILQNGEPADLRYIFYHIPEFPWLHPLGAYDNTSNDPPVRFPRKRRAAY